MSENLNNNLTAETVVDGVKINGESVDLTAGPCKKCRKGLVIGLVSAGAALVIGAVVFCLWFFLFRGDPFKEVAAMYEASKPSKIVATTTQTFGVEYDDNDEVVFSGHTLKGEHTLVIGEVDGKAAAVYKLVQDRLGTVEDGSGQDIKEPIFTDTTIKEYIEGTGLRITQNGSKGKWDSEGDSLIPERGAIALNISKDIADNVTYENNKLSFTVKEKNTAALFGAGNSVESDVDVEITTDGAFVIGVKISYYVPADEDNNVSESLITIDVVYTYDFEQINIA